ncbi:60S acidic ribosomal protein P0 [Astathelohania contejeani]|uniref:60S acidic ribosomal protein P0 n=1 Tax=Astathelohania contejeani TaxID=164912 RepID=A0ABQ7I1K4_9MICR|nr:60S acidic ribosomal protein P0 [Thelohania contejeani]
MSQLNKKERKAYIFEKTVRLFSTYNHFMVLGMDNITSSQLQTLKQNWRGKAEFLIGKNTAIRKALQEVLEKKPELKSVMNYLSGNVAFVFIKEDIGEIKKMIEENKRNTYAKVGAIAQGDVWLESHITGMGPDKTSFFQIMGILTKITKGKVEIIQRSKILTEGEKVTPSQANLLNILDMKPFVYQMAIKSVYEDGEMFSPALLDISLSDVEEALSKQLMSVASLSLGSGYSTEASVSFEIKNALKGVLGIAMAANYEIEETKKLGI